MAGLNERLSHEARYFDFFQAVSLLEEDARTRGGVRDPLSAGRVRLQCDDSLTFPPSDIAGIAVKHDQVRVLLTFMGLLGVSSPLPIYFSEYVSRYPDNADALRDFLAMFNHRVYALFYQSWRKYSMARTCSADGADVLTLRLAALAGIPASGALSAEQRRLVAYCGVLAGNSRGGAGLAALLSDFFGGIPVTVVNWIPRWAEIPNPPRLGANSQLGVTSIAGTTTLDMAGKFRVSIGPLHRDVYQAFLPGCENIARLQSLVELYCTDPLDYDVEVKLEAADLVPVVLGSATAPLGVTSSLGQTRRMSDVHSVVIAH